MERATTLNVKRVSRAWAGLRTFASDASPVVGFDSSAPGFFWLAGQGGYGIKTSPSLSRACACLIRDGRLPDDLMRLGITASQLSPGRLRGRHSRLNSPSPLGGNDLPHPPFENRSPSCPP